jgi:hypothetical protein
MNRELKFRGLPLEEETSGQQWHIGSYAYLNQRNGGMGPGHWISNQTGAPFGFLVNPETVGQYTGLKAADGTEIWEDDLVIKRSFNRPPNDHAPEKPFLVQWSPAQCGWNIRDPKFNGGHYEYVVVGNIHQNPELLEAA